ncbi:hypothetical protein [Bradyrhizobium sp. CCBAU 51753]|uniref:hypothetical protein n=1 Tax=Bradyrhizobium sp. CCBAU 51753 TaxID=1325100 RepID=UPI00188A5C6A|nr:hypothetical protein [Bradyrhizobium sp. CCBAU 51753]QOZ22592.1 hypothetical protein XH93_02175 [Bradyrhizobium sp. CCBAU 51753]
MSNGTMFSRHNPSAGPSYRRGWVDGTVSAIEHYGGNCDLIDDGRALCAEAASTRRHSPKRVSLAAVRLSFGN